MAKKGAYKVSIQGYGTMYFDNKKDMARIKYLTDLFLTGTPKHTNIETAVNIAGDAPASKPSPSGLGRIVNIKEISQKEWDKKGYKNVETYSRSVEKVNPRSQVGVKYSEGKEENRYTYTRDKTWKGAPYSDEELEPQNLRYTFNQNSVSTGCTSCVGLLSNEVGVADCNGNFAGWFPAAVKYDPISNTYSEITNADIGTTIQCINADQTCDSVGCGLGPWIIDTVLGHNPIYDTSFPRCSFLELGAQCQTTDCAVPGTTPQAINSSTGALNPCAVVTAYVTDGSIGGFDNVNKGVFITPDSINDPGVGFQIMNEQDTWNLINSAVQLPPFNLDNGGLGSSQGSIAKLGNKIYTWFPYTPNIGPSTWKLVELEIDPTGTTLLFSNIYSINAGTATTGVALCGKATNVLLSNENQDIYQLTLDPGTSTFTKSLLFTTIGSPAGDMVWDPSDNTIWIAEMLEIVHYDINGNVLGSLSSGGFVVSMWCQDGEVLFRSGPLGFVKIDKINHTTISLGFGGQPLYLNGPGGDAASDPTCCGVTTSTNPTCTPPGQSLTPPL